MISPIAYSQFINSAKKKCRSHWRNSSKRSLTISSASVQNVIEGYESLHEDYYLPDPPACFGVGYRLTDEYGHHRETLQEGIKTACRESSRMLGEKLKTTIANFARSRPPQRRALAVDFAEHIAKDISPFVRDLITYEAHMSHPKPLDFVTEHFGKEAHASLRIFKVSRDVKMVRLEHDIHGYMNGQCTETEAACEAGIWLALRPTPEQDMIVVELTEEDAVILSQGIATDKPLSPTSFSKARLKPYWS